MHWAKKDHPRLKIGPLSRSKPLLWVPARRGPKQGQACPHPRLLGGELTPAQAGVGGQHYCNAFACRGQAPAVPLDRTSAAGMVEILAKQIGFGQLI